MRIPLSDWREIIIAQETKSVYQACNETLVTFKHTALVKRCFVPQGYQSPLAKPKRRTPHTTGLFPRAFHGNRAQRRMDLKPASNPQCTKKRG